MDKEDEQDIQDWVKSEDTAVISLSKPILHILNILFIHVKTSSPLPLLVYLPNLRSTSPLPISSRIGRPWGQV